VVDVMVHVADAMQCTALQGKRVLVVDDDHDTREVLTVVLELNGAVVASADSAAEAVKAFEAHPPHLIISDIGLPDEDGFTLLRRLRSLPGGHGQRLRAIAVTGYDQADADGQLGGFDAQLTKPVALEGMLEVIATTLRSA
jgi:CheY-like chemotaxis protein